MTDFATPEDALVDLLDLAVETWEEKYPDELVLLGVLPTRIVIMASTAPTAAALRKAAASLLNAADDADDTPPALECLE